MKSKVKSLIPAYEVLGSGPAVVLLDGASRDESAAIAAAGYRVVLPALTSVTAASADGRGDAPVQQADAVAALLGYLGIGRAAFVGRGQSGQLLQLLCERHPRRVVAAGFVAAGCSEFLAATDSRVRILSARSSDFKKSLIDFLLGLSRSLHARPVLRAVA